MLNEVYKGIGCLKCPVSQWDCNAQYRGSRCAALRAKVGADFDPKGNEGATINKACRNCKYQQDGYCDNKQFLKKPSNQFEIESKVRIKDDSKCCEFYSFNEHLLQHLIYEEAQSRERFTGYQIAEDGASFTELKGSPADCHHDVLQRLAAIEDILFDAEGKEVVSLGKLRELVQTGLSKEVIVETEDDREYIDYICPKCKDIIEQRRKGTIEPYQPKYHDLCG